MPFGVMLFDPFSDGPGSFAKVNDLGLRLCHAASKPEREILVLLLLWIVKASLGFSAVTCESLRFLFFATCYAELKRRLD
jgi:hypothetical protein